MNILTIIAQFLNAPLIVMLALAGFHVPTQAEYAALVQDATLGDAVANTIAGFETSLASSITDTDTTMTLVSFTTEDGTDLTVGKTYSFTIDEGSASREFVTGEVSTGNSIINMTRGVSVVDGVTEVAANKKNHRRGASVKITNFQLVTITNILNTTATLPNVLEYDTSVDFDAINADDQYVASKAYVDAVAFSGAGVVDAQETAKGVVELATQAEMAAGTATGGSGPLVLQSGYALSTAPVSGQYVVITESSGNIDEDFLPSTLAGDYTISGDNTLSGTNIFSGTAYGVGKVDVYTSSDTWTKPTGAAFVKVIAIGAGGGGGGGYRGSNQVGGGGGGAGGFSSNVFAASELSSTETITVGSGGAGGAGKTGSDGAGANGSAGGDSSFGSYVVAKGGSGGSSNQTAGSGGVGNVVSGGAGGAGGAASSNGTAAASTVDIAPTGGGGGGGNGGTDSNNNGAAGGSKTLVTHSGGSGATAAGGNGTSGSALTDTIGGTGGGGGGASYSTATDGGDGGNGGSYGAAGGGAGAGTTTGGDGGDGAGGLVIVITY